MKYIKKFNESNTEEFDMNTAVAAIMAQFPEEEVVERFDMEILEWVDSDWEDDYDSEYDWYIDHNNGEAQDVVINELIDWYKKQQNIDLDDSMELFDRLKDSYGL